MQYEKQQTLAKTGVQHHFWLPEIKSPYSMGGHLHSPSFNAETALFGT